MLFYFHLYMWVIYKGLAPEASLEGLGLPPEGQGWRWCSYLGHRGFGCTRYSGELAVRAAGNIVL